MSALGLFFDKLLRDPDASSSVLPLIIVLTILLTLTIVILAKVAATFTKLELRWPPSVKKLELPKPAATLYVLTQAKFRHYFHRVFVTPSSSSPTSSSNHEELSMHIARLEQANAVERDLHGRAVSKIAELDSTVQELKTKNVELSKFLEIEILRRKKIEERAENLETKLKDAIAETERLYQQTAKLAETHPQPPDGVPEIFSGEALVAEQAAEIDRLKSVLRECKLRMLEMGKQSKSP